MGTAGDGRKNGPAWYEGPESEMGVQPEADRGDIAAERNLEGLPVCALVYLVGKLGSETDTPKDRHPTVPELLEVKAEDLGFPLNTTEHDGNLLRWK